MSNKIQVVLVIMLAAVFMMGLTVTSRNWPEVFVDDVVTKTYSIAGLAAGVTTTLPTDNRPYEFHAIGNTFYVACSNGTPTVDHTATNFAFAVQDGQRITKMINVGGTLKCKHITVADGGIIVIQLKKHPNDS